MVGHLILLKMLHCKFHRKKKKKYSNINNYCDNKITETITLKEEYNTQNEVQNICRVCLKFGNIPIYGNNKEEISEALQRFGDILIELGDVYPKFICQSCNALLQGAILLRKTAQESDELLRQADKETPDLDDQIQSDDQDGSVCEDQEDSKKIYNCKKCDQDFCSFKEYNEHRLSQEHENLRQTCPICKNSYTTPYFKRHLALHKLETPYMCDVCGKKFIVQGQFKRHRVTHFYNLPFKCSLCPYKGRFSESLKMHMRSHTGEKPYQCTQCASRFVNKSNLNKHMLTHKGDHDFKCDSCGKGFYTKRDLDLHFKVDHTGIKDHVCNLCGKAFGYRKQMMKHQLKVHKRQKLKSGRMPLYLQIQDRRQDIND